MVARARFACLAAALAVSCASPREPAAGDDELVGGRPAEATDYPSAILIRLGCTAAKVGPRHVLTAAHCVQDGKSRGIAAAYAPGQRLRVTTKERSSVPGQIFWRIGGFVEGTIERTEVPDAWLAALVAHGDAVHVLGADAPPDLALITLTEGSEAALLPIATATIDTTPVRPGDRLTIMGYGCEKGLEAGVDLADLAVSALRLHDTRALEPEKLLHRGSFVGSLTTDRGQNLLGSYLFTPGKNLDPAEASLCPGDSGGPVYRTGELSDTLVGINAYYTFLPTEEDRLKVSVTNWHTRVDGESRFAVAAWLEARGARVGRSEPAR